MRNIKFRKKRNKFQLIYKGERLMKAWRFVSNNNSTIVGINDAGIETFTANMNRSLVRETIQNSLDAMLPEKDYVTVEFSCFELPTSSIPDVDTFKSVFSKCKESNRNEPDAFKFFDNAVKTISKPTINVLRISDHNTMGLEGSDTCAKGTAWSRLVKESGSSNKGLGSGGSFGIGKSAAFACSDVRTVFYSSKDSLGYHSNIGVARLVSFEDPKVGGWTTGVGYYSEDDRFVAIPELASFDSNYIRQDFGTDIYILGIHKPDDFKEELIRAVLLNFLVSLVKKKLIVKIQDDIIDDKTLPLYMSRLNPHDGEEIKDLIEYHRILTSSDPRIRKIVLDSDRYGRKYGFANGECTLYLMEGEGFNRKIMITRKAGMKILELNRISGSIEFTGVLIIEGNNMNEAFKKMEVPSHDAWEPGRCRGEEKYYNNILSDLRRYLRDIVKECFAKVDSTSMDAFGASDFLPDKKDEGQEEKMQKDEMSTRIKSIDEKTVEPSKTRVKADDIAEAEPILGAGSGGSGKASNATPNPMPDSDVESRSGPNPGSNPEQGGEDLGKETAYKEIRVKKRLICKEVEKGIYVLTMIVPSSASRSKLEFTISGEQNDFELPIMDAKVVSAGDTQVVDIKKNAVYLKNLDKGVSLKLEVQVDFDGYCMMEVDYYANKK